MKKIKLLGVEFENLSKESIREKIIKYIQSPHGFFHIVSLNPENLVVAQRDEEFKKVLATAQIQLVDGVGVAVGGQFVSGTSLIRITGVDMFQGLLTHVGKERLKALFIGGKANLALRLAQCQKEIWPQAKFFGLEGFKNIQQPEKSEEEAIFSIVAKERPQMIFVAFGSPFQEKWLYHNRERLDGIICMGVGGGFDFVGGEISRAPRIFRRLGFEWLYRLVRQPWRWRRQLRLLEFIGLVLKEKFHA